MEIEEMLNRYRDLGDRYAPARAKRGYLEDYKHSLEAQLMKEYEKVGAESAAAQRRVDGVDETRRSDEVEGHQTGRQR